MLVLTISADDEKLTTSGDFQTIEVPIIKIICQPYPKCLDFPNVVEIKIEKKIIKPAVIKSDETKQIGILNEA